MIALEYRRKIHLKDKLSLTWDLSYCSFNYVFILSLWMGFTISQANAQLVQLSQPRIEQYFGEDHNGGTQTWDIIHIGNGHSFFANNSGVLHYDGISWELWSTPRETVARSLAFDPEDSLLYVGSQSEFGYFDVGSFPIEYHSLMDDIPIEYSDFADVWDLVMIGRELYFWSGRNIYHYQDSEFDIYSVDHEIEFLAKAGKRIYYNQKGKGLFLFHEDTEDELILQTDAELVDLIELNEGGYMLLSRDSGIWIDNGKGIHIWDTVNGGELSESIVRTGYFWKSRDWVCIGTQLSGLLIYDLEGRLIYLLDRSKGLANNTITTIQPDEGGKLWIGSFIDIAEIVLGEEQGVLYPDGGLQGAVYDVELWNGMYYFATSNGLFALRQKDLYDPLHDAFVRIEGTQGECWGLDIVKNQLFLAHDRGAFVIEASGVVKSLYSESGVWKFISLTQGQMALGAYDGIHLYEEGEEGWRYTRSVESIEESSRFLIYTSEGEFWMTHPYKGVYHIDLKSEDDGVDSIVRHSQYGELGEPRSCYGFSFGGQFVLVNGDQPYAYDRSLDSFVVDLRLSELFAGEELLRILEFGGEPHYISDRWIGKLIQKTVGSMSSLEKLELFPSDARLIGGFENAVKLEDQYFICQDRGVNLRSITKERRKLKLALQWVQVQDSFLFKGLTGQVLPYMKLENEARVIQVGLVPYSDNLLTEDIELFCFLKSGNQSGMVPVSNGIVHLENLAPGRYSLDCQLSHQGESEVYPGILEFSIRHPWYWTLPARGLYALLILFAVSSLSYLPTIRERRMKKTLQKEKDAVDSQYEQLAREKRQVEYRAMEGELANSTMHLLQKTELINSLRKEITSIVSKVKDPTARKELKMITTRLKEDNRLEEDWQNFTRHFNRIHNDFLNRLKDQYPQLTSNDLKLCAYLRLNLRTKEIAPLMGISIRGVEISRYRLRKKMDLEKDVNLNEFMISF